MSPNYYYWCCCCYLLITWQAVVVVKEEGSSPPGLLSCDIFKIVPAGFVPLCHPVRGLWFESTDSSGSKPCLAWGGVILGSLAALQAFAPRVGLGTWDFSPSGQGIAGRCWKRRCSAAPAPATLPAQCSSPWEPAPGTGWCARRGLLILGVKIGSFASWEKIGNSWFALPSLRSSSQIFFCSLLWKKPQCFTG